MKHESILESQSDAPPANAFARLLSELRDGECLQEASEILNDLVMKMRERLRPCEMTITLKFTPAAGASIVTITDEIKVKAPKEDKQATIRFTTEDGILTGKNPDQKELQLREVHRTTGPLKSIAEDEEAQLKAAGAE